MATFTEDELTALRKAYASGLRSVTYRDRTVVYDDADAILRRIRTLEADLGHGSSFDSRARNAKTSKDV